MWPDKISPESVAGEKYQGYCFLTNMPGTKGDPKSSQTVGVEEKIVAEEMRFWGYEKYILLKIR